MVDILPPKEIDETPTVSSVKPQPTSTFKPNPEIRSDKDEQLALAIYRRAQEHCKDMTTEALIEHCEAVYVWIKS
jgi:hypothetical protein